MRYTMFRMLIKVANIQKTCLPYFKKHQYVYLKYGLSKDAPIHKSKPVEENNFFLNITHLIMRLEMSTDTRKS